MSNLATRTLTGIALVVLVIAAIVAGWPFFAGLFLLFTMVGLWEFYRLVERAGVFPNKYAGVLAGIVLFSTNAFIATNNAGMEWLLINFVVIFLIFLLELYRNNPNPFTNIAFTFFGLLYVAVPFSLLNYFPNPGFATDAYHHSTLLGFFFFVWINETGAYLVGTAFGRTPLFKRISPKKTWEGAIGGGVLTLLSVLFVSLYYDHLLLGQWFIIAGIVVVFGSYGDLFESMFKRSIDAKDSGRILPGHGGVLDRFDGVFMAAPFVFVYLLMTHA